MDQKSGPLVSFKVTDEAKGEVEAVFATLNVIDKDGDVTRPDAFGEQKVRISAYNHKSWDGALPVGKGIIQERGSEAVLKSQFFMNTQAGKETFTVIKELGELMEWSYGYDVLSKSEGKWTDGVGEDENGKDVRFLDKIKVHEVSPVILGAGENTHTVSAKGNGKDGDKGAIPYSSTGTTDVNWDAGMMRRRVTASSAALRALNAWVDPSGDANSKGAYKFPHHMVSENGAVGAANTRACSAAIAVLNGGRGGSSIPAGDRDGVYNHVAHHIRDAGGTPPPLKNWTEYQEALKESRKAPLTSDQISSASDVVEALDNLLDPDDAPTLEAVSALIDKLQNAVGDSQTSSFDFTGGVKLFDHLAWLYAELEVGSKRFADAVAQRAENGQKLSDETLDVAKMIVSECDELREAIAIQPRKDNVSEEELQHLRRLSESILFLSERHHS